MISKKAPSDYCNESFDREEQSQPDNLSWQFSAENICGEGASCIVYRIQHDGVRVAVKRLKESQLGNPDYVNGFKKEYAIGRNLKHDALPVYRELRAETDEVYIVMDYVDGMTVKDFVRTNEGKEYFRSTANVRRFFSGLVGAVAYLHRSGVIHCDIKPANIMLRHSDRGVMLLDLDKSYSDTRDNTHGGTTNSSDPLPAREAPTAQKDILAIGRLFDNIAEKVLGFPTQKFKRFRSDCDKDGVTIDTLSSDLQARPKGLWLPVLITITIALVFIILALIGRKSTDVAQPTPAIKDTIVTVIENRQPETPPQIAQPQTIEINFDTEMESFTAEAQSTLDRLSAGSLSDAEISDLMMLLVERYTTAYGQLTEQSKADYPQTPAIDVEMAVAREAEQSRASRLLQQFTRAATDTINAHSGAPD